jgi:hypothetical protein
LESQARSEKEAYWKYARRRATKHVISRTSLAMGAIRDIP